VFLLWFFGVFFLVQVFFFLPPFVLATRLCYADFVFVTWFERDVAPWPKGAYADCPTGLAHVRALPFRVFSWFLSSRGPGIWFLFFDCVVRLKRPRCLLRRFPPEFVDAPVLGPLPPPQVCPPWSNLQVMQRAFCEFFGVRSYFLLCT